MKSFLSHSFWAILTFLFLTGCVTKLQSAALNGNVENVLELLEKGESISETDFYGWTALHYSARYGQDTIVNLLLNKGAEINAQGKHGETPLYVAARNCHEKVVRTLLGKGVNISVKVQYDDNDGLLWTPLLIASEEGCAAKIVKDLLNAGADANETQQPYGTSPLMWSAMIGTFQPIEVLLSAGAAVNHQANDGFTALMVAAFYGSKEVAQVLLEAGADTAIRVNQASGPLNRNLEPTDTALTIARRQEHDGIVALLEMAQRTKN